MANKIPLAIADFETQLATSLAVGGTTFTLASGTDDDGNALPAGKYCFTIDNGKSTKEYLLGQLNGTSVTSVVRVSRQGVETSGTAYKHRVGAPVAVTDFATIQRVADILRGQLDLDGSAPISYDAEPTLSARESIATVGYVLDTAAGGAVTFDKQTTTGTAGENVVEGDLIYFKSSDQEWYKADADDTAKSVGVQLGIALGTGSDGVAITNGVQISGVYTTTSLTAGSDYFAGNTAGSISTTSGTNTRALGVALSTTKLLLNNLGSNSPQGLGSYVPTGTVLPYSGSSAPTSYLLCDGSEVSRTTYSSLFSVIGTAYGAGDTSTTFNVPDFGGRVGIGSGARTLGTVTCDYSAMTYLDTTTSINVSADVIIDSGGIYSTTGDEIIFASTTNGWTAGVVYYAIYYASTQTRIATSRVNALAGTYQQLTNTNNSNYYTHALFTTTTLPDDVETGDTVEFSTNGTAPTNLPEGTYYLIKVNQTSFYLADSYANAIAGYRKAAASSGSGTFSFVIKKPSLSAGATGGRSLHVLTVDEMPSHNHIIGGAGSGTYEAMSTLTEAGTVYSSNTGGGQPHNNMQPYVVMNYIIKY